MTQNKLPLMPGNTAPEYFATELVSVEGLGQCARLSFAVPRQVGAEAYREVIVTIVVPTAALCGIGRQCLQSPREIRSGNAEADFESHEELPSARH